MGTNMKPAASNRKPVGTNRKPVAQTENRLARKPTNVGGTATKRAFIARPHRLSIVVAKYRRLFPGTTIGSRPQPSIVSTPPDHIGPSRPHQPDGVPTALGSAHLFRLLVPRALGPAHLFCLHPTHRPAHFSTCTQSPSALRFVCAQSAPLSISHVHSQRHCLEWITWTRVG